MTREEVLKVVIDRIVSVCENQHSEAPPSASDIKESDPINRYIDSLDTLELAFEIEEEYEIEFEINATDMGSITICNIADQACEAILAKGTS